MGLTQNVGFVPIRVRVVTPAARGSTRGNRVTAERWAGVLRSLGHDVSIETEWSGGPCDLLVALHARRSARSVARARRARPDLPIVLALTGTDAYHDLARSAVASRTLDRADLFVVLQPLAVKTLPARLRSRARVVYQSVARPRSRAKPAPGFQVCVLGHLRPVKDPFRAAIAARRLPPSSSVRVVHVGAPLSAAMAARARAEERRNPRYRWVGEVSRPEAMRLLAASRVVVVSSRLEGGANAVGEAVVLGVPVLASRIPGNVGLLGDDYPGYFAVGDTAGLASLLRRVEAEPKFLARLRRACSRRAKLFSQSRERAAWRAIVAETTRRAAHAGSSALRSALE